MKKVLLAIFFLGLFSSLNASDTKLFVGLTAGEIDDTSYKQLTIGQSSFLINQEEFSLGFANSLSYGTVRGSKSATTVDLDFRLGYNISYNLSLYAIGTGAVQYYDHSAYTGIGYGGALEFFLTPNISLEGTYKTLTMSKTNNSYDYDAAMLSVKVGF